MVDVEEHIRRAREEGKLDDLIGKGKPLNLNENPYEDPEWRSANLILKNAGFTLSWIENKQEIEGQIDALRKRLSQSWQRKISMQNRNLSHAEAYWEKAQHDFRTEIEAINKKIFNYNIEAPLPRFQLTVLNPDREIEKMISGEMNQDDTGKI
jgi:DnaJ homolog subfamily C member 28